MYCSMAYLHCNYSDLLAEELDLGQQTNIHRCTRGFHKNVEIFEDRGPCSHREPLSILIKFGMRISIWSIYIVIVATCWNTFQS